MDNRQQILHCALQLFAARGYDAVGIQEIVDVAGITKPTLYHYFGSKRGLLDAVVREYADPFTQHIRQASAYQGDLTGTLTKIVSTAFQYARENPTFYRLHLALWFAPSESDALQTVAPIHEHLYTLIEAVFAQAVADHGNMRGRQQAYATTFWGMINTYVVLALNNYTELNDHLVAQAVRQFSYGIYS